MIFLQVEWVQRKRNCVQYSNGIDTKKANVNFDRALNTRILPCFKSLHDCKLVEEILRNESNIKFPRKNSIMLSANGISLLIIPTRLGGGVKLTPPLARKKKFIFKWLMGRLCDLMTFTGNIRGSFWPNLRVISIFFELLQMSKVKMRPKKRQKIDFSNFESLLHKNG